MSIGERLEEARKRKGISLREAAEGTKIRTDFLAAFEKDEFGFNLPEVYKLGFLRSYARFLGIDDTQIVIDYQAKMQTISRSNFLKKDGKDEEGNPVQPTKVRKSPGIASISLFKGKSNSKVKLMVGGVVAIVLLAVFIFMSLFSNKDRNITIESTGRIGLVVNFYEGSEGRAKEEFRGIFGPNEAKNQLVYTLKDKQYLEIICANERYFDSIKISKNGKNLPIDLRQVTGPDNYKKYRVE